MQIINIQQRYIPKNAIFKNHFEPYIDIYFVLTITDANVFVNTRLLQSYQNYI
jgi:hypothetical protein